MIFPLDAENSNGNVLQDGINKREAFIREHK